VLLVLVWDFGQVVMFRWLFQKQSISYVQMSMLARTWMVTWVYINIVFSTAATGVSFLFGNLFNYKVYFVWMYHGYIFSINSCVYCKLNILCQWKIVNVSANINSRVKISYITFFTIILLSYIHIINQQAFHIFSRHVILFFQLVSLYIGQCNSSC